MSMAVLARDREAEREGGEAIREKAATERMELVACLVDASEDHAADPDIGARPAIRFGDQVWTHADYLRESSRWANLFLDRLPAGRPRHVAVLLDNLPEYLFAFGGAALIGADPSYSVTPPSGELPLG